MTEVREFPATLAFDLSVGIADNLTELGAVLRGATAFSRGSLSWYHGAMRTALSVTQSSSRESADRAWRSAAWVRQSFYFAPGFEEPSLSDDPFTVLGQGRWTLRLQLSAGVREGIGEWSGEELGIAVKFQHRRIVYGERSVSVRDEWVEPFVMWRGQSGHLLGVHGATSVKFAELPKTTLSGLLFLDGDTDATGIVRVGYDFRMSDLDVTLYAGVGAVFTSDGTRFQLVANLGRQFLRPLGRGLDDILR